MKPEIKKLWTDALRSGEYKQGRRSLITYDRNTIPYDQIVPVPNGTPNEEQLKAAQYCCLGVLCDLYRKEHGKNLWYRFRFEDAFGVPPKCVIEWAELEIENPIVKINDKIRSLAELNDKLKFNFEEIADVIEKQL